MSFLSPIRLKEISHELIIESPDTIRKAIIGHFLIKFGHSLGLSETFIRKHKIARPMPSEVKELYTGRKKIMNASE